jgi:DNA-binding MarR family transcriptional regulator
MEKIAKIKDIARQLKLDPSRVTYISYGSL